MDPQPGMKGTLHRRDPDARPKDGTVVTITKEHRAGIHVYAETPWGTDVLLPKSQVDCGREWRTARGEWIPESDPRVESWLCKAIADIDAGGTRACDSRDPEYRAKVRQDFCWVLRRNGRAVP